MNERLLKIQVVARKKSHLAALALAHRAHNTHHTQAVEITGGALRAGLGGVQVWTAAQSMGLTPNAVTRMLSGLSAMRELSAADGTTEARDFNKSMASLRRLADVHAARFTRRQTRGRQRVSSARAARHCDRQRRGFSSEPTRA